MQWSVQSANESTQEKTVEDRPLGPADKRFIAVDDQA